MNAVKMVYSDPYWAFKTRFYIC